MFLVVTETAMEYKHLVLIQGQDKTGAFSGKVPGPTTQMLPWQIP